ncbi:hypothetical protein FOMG_19969 [Fusarium oxysporum f. sp. melonis 26406]|uniref:Uncharacterized protein n=1 Tax=Fusarium oxysporum f. sp. melonis 26406 TaxID=1089452 RepID=W9Z4R2_FUSOX|nr:hypothetical protein FOMG_19969 [Fusarium oxysporum f. sp. melonis 26406]
MIEVKGASKCSANRVFGIVTMTCFLINFTIYDLIQDDSVDT